MAAEPPRRARPRGERRRAEILDAATQVFLENGYGGATIDLVVARAGASKATVYSFFGGKEGLFAAIVEERAERTLLAFLDISVSDVDVPTALAQIGRRFMEVAMAPGAVGIYRLILAEGARFPELTRTFFRLGPDRICAYLASVFMNWQERGLITVENHALTAAQFLDAVRGDLLLRVVAGVPPDDLEAAVERHVRNAVQTFWTGIRPAGGPS